MVSHGYEHEEKRRRMLGLLTWRWYKCHGCGKEYSLADGVRAGWGCNNDCCLAPNIHLHSDLDGEKPTTL